MKKIIERLFRSQKKMYSIGRYTTSCPVLFEIYREMAMKELRRG